MSNFKHAELANVFDALADYIDQTEGERLREKQAAQADRITRFAERYTESTGEEIPDALRGKLASLDEDVFEHVLMTTKTAGGSPDSLGGPVDDTETKTAGEEDADERMKRWLLS